MKILDVDFQGMLTRLYIYLKGVCMGAADIIPGVSGGTMALILGIYPRLIAAISNINLAWVPALYRMWLGPGETKDEARERFKQNILRMDPLFLLFLAAGILSAVAVGSLIITYFLDNYPASVRAFFFGLILASSWVPLYQVKEQLDWHGRQVAGILLVLIFCLGLAFVITSPKLGLQPPLRWKTVTSGGEDISGLLTRKMSAFSAGKLLEHPKNKDIRMDSGEVAAGEKVYIPRLPAWYLFLSAVVAICAMILPGVSGAYLLLMLGSYYYLLNIFNTFQASLASGKIAFLPLAYLLVFCIGAAAGLLIFARFIGFMLRRWKVLTMAGLTGLMLGGLHGLWPFYLLKNSVSIPWLELSVAFLAGVVVVNLLNMLGILTETEAAES